MSLETRVGDLRTIARDVSAECLRILQCPASWLCFRRFAGDVEVLRQLTFEVMNRAEPVLGDLKSAHRSLEILGNEWAMRRKTLTTSVVGGVLVGALLGALFALLEQRAHRGDQREDAG